MDQADRVPARLWGRLAQGGIALTIFGSALALGGADVRVALAAALVVFVLGVLAVPAGYLQRIPSPAIVLSGLGLYSLLQSCPLPITLLRKVSPQAASVWQYALSPFKEEMAVGSLSLDPGASSVEAAKFAAYGVTFCIAAGIARRRGAAAIVRVVFASALTVALVTVAHAVLGATKVFGVYEPKFAQPGMRLGPMLNANCLAGYLVLGVLCGLGLAFSRGRPASRALYLGGAFFMSCGVAVSGSRAGFAVLVAGATLFGLIAAKGLEQPTYDLSWRVVAAIAGTLVLATALSASLVPGAWELLVQTDMEKLRMSSWVLPLIAAFPFFGIGRGAFESVFPKYKPPLDTLRYSHPENILAQWTTEWGVIGLGALVLIVWLMRPKTLSLRKHPTALGAMIGVAAITMQNFLDLGLELFAPMVAVVALMGACWGQVPKPPRTWKDSQWLGFGILGTALITLALAFSRGRNPLEIERAALAAESTRVNATDSAAVDRLTGAIRSAMLRHPAEYFFPRIGAFVALRAGRNVLPWVSRALELCETDSGTHWALAIALYRHGLLSQALLEARLSAEYDSALTGTVGTTVAGWSQRFEDLERAAPLGPRGAAVLYAEVLALRRPSYAKLREDLLRLAIRKDPASSLLRITLANELLHRLSAQGSAGADSERRVAEISTLAASLQTMDPDSAVGSEIFARLYAETRQFEEGERRLTERCELLSGRQQYRCWDALVALAGSNPENKPLIDRAVQRLVRVACVDDEYCPDALLRAGDTMAKVSNWLEALAYYERAAAKAPNVSTLLRVVDAAGALGRGSVVERALSMAQARAHGDPAALAQIEHKRTALAHLSLE